MGKRQFVAKNSTAKATGRNGKVSYGKLSRADREFVAEHGHLQQDDIDVSEDIQLDNSRVFKESDLDGRPSSGKRFKSHDGRVDPSPSENVVADESEEEQETVSPYTLLLKSLAAQEPESEDDASEGEDVSDEELYDEGDEQEGDEEFDSMDDEDAVEESESEVELDAEEEELSSDSYLRHFVDAESHLDSNIKKISAGEWKKTVLRDDVLESVISTSLADQMDASLEPAKDLNCFQAKQRLLEVWNASSDEGLTPIQAKMAPLIFDYKDVCLTSLTKSDDSEDLHDIFAFHALNHVLKSTDRILKNGDKLKKAGKDSDLELRDQGFTRPKVLALFPFKNQAFKFIDKIIALSNSDQQENKKRFVEEFGDKDCGDMDPSKPEDYQEIFSGNIDDCFRVGIKLARKSMKLYSPFYNSDILVASPLGLRMIIGAEGDRKRDFDFLSSIEVVIVDQMDVIAMQNWEHLNHVFEHMNLIPKESHDCDFSRVRNWYLNGQAKYMRQTILTSRFITPDINAFVKKYCTNFEGLVKNKSATPNGTMSSVLPNVQHVFTRIPASALAEVDDVRFKYFTTKTFPLLRQSIIQSSHTCIVVPSYFDFLKLSAWFRREEISFTSLSEYTSNADISRARSDFFHERSSFLLITERFHFFRRYLIRGMHNVVFYAPTSYAHFYSEFVNMLCSDSSKASLANDTSSSVTMLYSRYDALALERIVGTEVVPKLIKGDKDVYLFA